MYVAATSPLGASIQTSFAVMPAAVYWVDAQWAFPPPAINPVGSRHVFTTTLNRQSNGTPLAGWLVRYEVLSGPDAGFGPQGVKAIEVQTNELGQAGVELTQRAPVAGSNQIGIQVIRPEGFGGPRIVLGNGTTVKTWTSASSAPSSHGRSTRRPKT